MVVKFDQQVWENYLIGYFVKAFKTVDVIFIDILVEGGTKGNVAPDARDPFVDATFDLKATSYSIWKLEMKIMYGSKD
jgi:hypothetical protein